MEFGIAGFTGNSGSAGVTEIFKLGENGNEIAGWSMTTSSISNGQVELSSTLPGLTIDNEFGEDRDDYMSLVHSQIQLVEQTRCLIVTLVLKLEQQTILNRTKRWSECRKSTK